MLVELFDCQRRILKVFFHLVALWFAFYLWELCLRTTTDSKQNVFVGGLSLSENYSKGDLAFEPAHAQLYRENTD